MGWKVRDRHSGGDNGAESRMTRNHLCVGLGEELLTNVSFPSGFSMQISSCFSSSPKGK